MNKSKVIILSLASFLWEDVKYLTFYVEYADKFGSGSHKHFHPFQ